MTPKAKTTLALVLSAVITLASCTHPVYLPSLYPAPGFTLTNQNGQVVELAHFRGKVIVMDFVYTRCPDVCGELNYELQGIWHQLKEELRQDLVLISISFDLYDTPEVLKQYATFYDVPGWQFLTGTKEQIQQVTSDYGIGYEIKTAGANHTQAGPHPVEFIHNSSVVLIDREGTVRKTYGGPELPVKDMVREFTHLLNQQSKQ